MILSERTWKSCGECGARHEGDPASYGCDTCEKPLGDERYLKIDIFSHKDDVGHSEMQFCSWQCLFTKLPEVQTDYFVSLPYLSFDEEWSGMTVADFFQAIREYK